MSPPAVPPMPFVRFAQTSSVLTEDGASPYRFTGANIYWLMEQAASGREGRLNVQRVLEGAARLGLQVVRTWAFAEGPTSSSAPLRLRAGALHEPTAIGLDYVVSQAARRGLRLILPLLGYWNDFGGLRVVQEWCLPPEEQEYARGWQPFDACPRYYSTDACRNQYLEHAAQLMQRTNTLSGVAYRDDPTILMWEVCMQLLQGLTQWTQQCCPLPHSHSTACAHSYLTVWPGRVHCAA